MGRTRGSDLGIAALAACCAASACVADAAETGRTSPAVTEEFKARWYAGLAEVSRYDLEQWRYREVHRGDAVLVFVTEDFLPDKQVKHEGGTPSSPPRSVLKLNLVRKFDTGIYPYSIMTSVFTPVSGDPRTLKASCSVQEWCGHVYQQLNLRGDRYESELHSYFEAEADQHTPLPHALLEDEIWTRIRIDPGALPVGAVEAIPALYDARLSHRPSRVEPARATLEAGAEGIRVYRIDYDAIPRSLAIHFEQAFPHEIVEWEERHGSGPDGTERVTRARRTHSLMIDYWTKNSADDADWRRRLGLD